MNELEKRMKLIEKKAQSIKKEEEETRNNEAKRDSEALEKIKALTPRIEALIALANKCIEQKVPFPDSVEVGKLGYGKGKYGFFSDGIYHAVGFMREKGSAQVKCIGVVEGGFCGVWDFYTNGTETFVRHQNDKTRKDADYYQMIKFIERFESFETAFYRWIDGMTENRPEETDSNGSAPVFMITNGDVIRGGSNKDLACMIKCPYYTEDICSKKAKEACYQCKLDWLNSPEETD